MALLDAPLAKTASTLVQKFGRAIVLQSYGTAVYDVAASAARVTPVLQTVKAIPETLNAQAAAAVGSDVRAGDVRFIVAAADVQGVPDATWDMVVGGVRHEVVRVITTSAGDNPTLYAIVARFGA